MHPILEKALKLLSVTCSKSALHPSDEDRIKVTLRVLIKNGVAIAPAAIEQWLIANSWQAKPIKNIISWATAISNGGRVQLKNKTMAPTEKEVWQKLNA
jgi:hypothetical protein